MVEVGPTFSHDVEVIRAERRGTFYPKTDLASGCAPGGAACDEADPACDLTVERITPAVHAALGFIPTAVALLEQQGTFHRLYSVQLSDQSRCILRASRFGRARRDLGLLTDAWAAEALACVGVHAPRVYSVDLSRRWLPFDFALVEEVQGRTLSHLDADEPAMQMLLRQLGQVMAAVHGVRTSGFGLLDAGESMLERGCIGRGVLERWEDYVSLNLDEHLRYCRDIGAIESDEATHVEFVFGRLSPFLRNSVPALLHGDPGNHNVFTDGRGITALVDWEDALSGDPVFDLAFLATFHPERRHRCFLEGYRSVRALGDDFEVRFWGYFLRIAISKTVHRHRFGYTDKPGRSPASRRIQQGLAQTARALGLALA